MKVILSHDVDALGRVGDIVNVRNGYARNFLLPRGLCMPANEENQAALAHHKRVLDRKRAALLAEAKKLGIPIVAICDTNCDPDMADVIIPGNDDAIRAIRLVTQKMSEAILEARPLSDELTGDAPFVETLNADGTVDEEAPIQVDDELLKAFGADKEDA